MGTRPDQATMDQWYPIGSRASVPAGETRDRLLGSEILVEKTADAITVRETASGRVLPILERYQMLWTSLGNPPSDLFALPEANEPDRRIVDCGPVLVRASGLRMIENFLDMAHFPFVHTDILGAEPHTEVAHYTSEIRREVDEVWATNCQFFQPQAAASSAGGANVAYTYRVMTPFSTLLYKSSPNDATRSDIICLFVQPLDEAYCRAHPVMFLIDEETPLADLIQFQQFIFLQDRIILENQRPILLPLEPRSEIPTRADASSIAYRRWLKEKGVTYGTTTA
jgi:phenylpropionate dioxygenase-like ring-hydroxylating dioxygenase large terminal subunit